MAEATPESISGRGLPLTFVRWLKLAVFIYLGYLLLLGPIRALERHGVLIFPQGVDAVLWCGADFLFDVPFIGKLFLKYLHFWYVDPNFSVD